VSTVPSRASIVSFWSPPWRSSAPPLPSIVSFPPRPTRRFSPAEPTSVSLPANVPVMSSIEGSRLPPGPSLATPSSEAVSAAIPSSW
jgi:hypothetical protein